MEAPNAAGNAILRITGHGVSMAFELEGDIREGYTNRYVVPMGDVGSAFYTNPKRYDWKGGSLNPVGVTINLVVGVQSALQTAQDLIDAVGDFYKLALVEKEAPIQGPVTMEIGTWWSREGYIQNLNVIWKRPYDIETGMPMQAEVSFDFLTDYYAGELIIKDDRNPRAATWRFNSAGGSR